MFVQYTSLVSTKRNKKDRERKKADQVRLEVSFVDI